MNNFLKNFKYFIVLFFLGATISKESNAHSNSLGYVSTNSGSITVWFGGDHSSYSSPSAEGQIRLRKTDGSYDSSVTADTVFYSSDYTVLPSGLVAGDPSLSSTNVFVTDTSGNLAEYNGTGFTVCNSRQKYSYHWQSATFTGLSAGDYEISYIKQAVGASAEWTFSDPTCFGTAVSVTLSASDVGTDVNFASSVPADETTEVNLTLRTVDITFDTSVVAGSGNISLKKTSDNTTIESFDVNGSRVSGWGTSTITITWSNQLDPSTSYYVNIDSTAIDSSGGVSYAGISDNSTINFTMMGLPYLVSSSPTDNQTSVSDTTNTIVLNFNEAVTSGSGNIKVLKSDGTTFESISINSSNISGWGSTTLNVNLSQTLSNSTSYYVTIDNTAIKNTGSTFYAGISDSTSLNFSTTTETASPIDDPDVIGILEAQTELALMLLEKSVAPILRRTKNFRRNNREKLTFLDDVKLTFSNPNYNYLFNQMPLLANLSGNKLNLYEKDIKDDNCTSSEAHTNIVNNKKILNQEHILYANNESDINFPVKIPKVNIAKDKLNFWSSARLTVGETSATSLASLKDFKTDELTIGADKINSKNNLMGFAMRFSNNDIDIGNNGSNIDSQDYGLTLYGSIPFKKRSYFDFVFGINSIEHEILRVTQDEIPLTANRSGYQFFETIIFSKETVKNSYTITPYFRVDAGTTVLDPYSESASSSGSSSALSFNKQTISSIKTRAGLSIDYKKIYKKIKFIPFGVIEFGRSSANSTNSKINYVNSPATTYEYEFNDSDSRDYKLGLGLNIILKSGSLNFAFERIEEQAKNNNHDSYYDSFHLQGSFRF